MRVREDAGNENEALYNAKHTYRSIAHETGFSASSIYAEVQKGLYDRRDSRTWKLVKAYSADIGQQKADNAATNKGTSLKLGHNYDFARYVKEQIHRGWSPDAITGRLRRKGKWTVCTTTLYSYIDRGYIPDVTNENLLERGKRRKRSYKKIRKAKRPPRGTSIEQRPQDINDRFTPGHWEMDLVIGKQKGKRQALLVLTERVTRREISAHLPNKKAISVVRAFRRIYSAYPPGTFLSLTVDIGSEFQDFPGLEQDERGKKRLTVYFCHPYTSCERGTNENQNKLVRRFFPKGESMAQVTTRQVETMLDFVNNLPRKILGYATPEELFQDFLATLTKDFKEMFG